MRADLVPEHPVSSLLRPGHNCMSATHADRLAVLVDGAAYFDAFVAAVERAQQRVMILAWDFNSRFMLQRDAAGQPANPVGDFLNECARRRRGLHIFVLDWDYPMIFAADREFPPLYGLGWQPHRRVHFRYDDTHPLAGSHHQKIVVIDDRMAFVGGTDLTLRRWDTPAHAPNDARRIVNGKPYPPVHDIMAAVDGEAAVVLARIARERWRLATGETLEAVSETRDPWPPRLAADFADTRLGVATTMPPIAGEKVVHHVERLYLDMIARARRYIYIENQYLTSQKIAHALSGRLAEADCPEVIVVTRLLSHGWLEEVTMHVLRTRVVLALREADRAAGRAAGCFEAYYPHIDGLAAGTCIDTHSKVMIVDDEWLRIGSANLSNRSMGVDSECDIVIEAHGLQRIAQRIRAFRDQLLAEHTGSTPEAVAQAIDAHGGMAAAIAHLGTPQRRLEVLQPEPWPDGIVAAASIADLERPVELDALIESFSPNLEESRRRPFWVKLVAIAVGVAALTASWRYTPLAEIFAPQNVIEWTQSFAQQWWAPLVILLLYTPACIVMFPRPIITLAAVVTFGPWEGFAYAMGGVLIASTVGFYAGRLFGRNTVRRLAGKNLNKISRVLRRRGIVAMTALRLVPLAPFIVESLVAGAVHMRLWHVMLGTFIGMLPGLLTTTVLGDQLQAFLHDPQTADWMFVVVVAIVMLTLTLAVQRWLRREVAVK